MINVGEVYTSKKYFVKIEDFTNNDEVVYKFYNKNDFYYPPNVRRRPSNLKVEAGIKPIQVIEKFEDFTKKITKKHLVASPHKFGQEPILGEVFKANS